MHRCDWCPSIFIVSVLFFNARSVADSVSPPTIQSVVNAGSSDLRFSPGLLVTITGQGFNGVSSVSVGGKAGAVLTGGLYRVGANQIDAQLPVDLTTGPTTLTVTLGGQTSAPFAMTIAAYAPAFFNGFGSVCIDDDQTPIASVTAANPTTPGHIINCVLIGLGATKPVIPTGTSVGSVPPTVVSPTVTIGGENAAVASSFLVGGDPAIYEINVAIPDDMPKGNQDMVLTIGGVSTPPILLPVGQGPPVVTGTVLFSNFGPRYTFTGTISGFAVGPNSQNANIVIASRFVPSITAVFTGARVALTGPSTATVYLESDANGHPGSIIEQISITGLMSIQGRVPAAGSMLRPLLTAGTPYWIAIGAPSNNTIGSIWLNNSTGDLSDGTNEVSNGTGSPSGPWTAFPSGSPWVRGAFEVDGIPSGPPPPTILGVRNGGTFQLKDATHGGAANSFVSIYASNLGTSDTAQSVFPATSFNGLSVLLNGKSAPLYYVFGSVGQINLVLPSELPQTGVSMLTIQTSAGTSAAVSLTLAPTDVGVFRLTDPSNSARQNGAVLIANTAWRVVPASMAAALGWTACTGLPASSVCGQPAKPGDVLQIYFTGAGLATPNGDPSKSPVATGSFAPADGSTIYDTVVVPTVTIGGLPAQVLFSGIAPGNAGLYQINAIVPSGTQPGDNVPMVITTGNTTDTVTIAVSSP